MNTNISKDQHDNSAVIANETAGVAIASEADKSRIPCDCEQKPTSNGDGGGGRGRTGYPTNNRAPKKDRLPPKTYWELIKKRFSPLWACYPLEGRRDYQDCLTYYNTIKDSVPSAAYICGVVKYFSDNVWNGFIPSFKKFFENKEWLGVSHKVSADIERNKAHWERKAQENIDQFNGVSYKAQTNMRLQSEQEPQEPPLISDDVPPAEEIVRMLPREQLKLAAEHGYGSPISDFLEAVRHRDQLRNKKQEVI